MSAPARPGPESAGEATARPSWSVHSHWPTYIVPADDIDKRRGGSSHQDQDAQYARKIAVCYDDDFAKTGWPHRFTREQAIAHAALIVTAVNAHDDLVAALREAAAVLADFEADDEDRANVHFRCIAALAKATGAAE